MTASGCLAALAAVLFAGPAAAAGSLDIRLPELPPSGLVAIAPAAPLLPSEIHYKISGPEQAPPLVLIHGLDSSAATFAPVVGELSKRYRVIAYDQRGHGSSAAPGYDYSVATMAGDLAALFDHLGLKDAHILGHSNGARTALKFAELNPGRVRSLIIEDMETIARGPASADNGLREAKLLENIPRKFGSREELLAALSPHYGARAEWVVKTRAWRNPKGGAWELLFRPHVSVLYAQAAGAVDLTPALAQLRRPVLVIRADPSKSAVSDRGLEVMRLAAPAAEVVTIAGAKHNVHGSKTREYLDAVLSFLSRVRASSY